MIFFFPQLTDIDFLDMNQQFFFFNDTAGSNTSKGRSRNRVYKLTKRRQPDSLQLGVRLTLKKKLLKIKVDI